MLSSRAPGTGGAGTQPPQFRSRTCAQTFNSCKWIILYIIIIMIIISIIIMLFVIGVEVRRSWAEYFEQVLNVADVREANINVSGDRRMLLLRELNQRAISIEEVRETVNEMKSGKAPGLDGFQVECLKWHDSVEMASETVEHKF